VKILSAIHDSLTFYSRYVHLTPDTYAGFRNGTYSYIPSLLINIVQANTLKSLPLPQHLISKLLQAFDFTVVPRQPLNSLHIELLLELAKHMQDFSPAQQMFLCQCIPALSTYTPHPLSFFNFFAPELAASPFITEDHNPFTSNPTSAAEILSFYEKSISHFHDYMAHSTPLAVLMPSVSGKTSLAARLPHHLTDVDSLTNAVERDQLTHFLELATITGDWSHVNRFWQSIITRKHRKTTILLAHSPEQLPVGYRYFIINTPTEPYLTKKITPLRRATAIQNRAELLKYKDLPEYMFFTRPHLIYKFFTQLIVNPDFSVSVNAPRSWYYGIRSLQCLWLLTHTHPLHQDHARRRKYLTIEYDAYTTVMKSAEGFVECPLMAYFTPTYLYQTSRYRPRAFDITLGPFSDSCMIYRTSKPYAVHFFKYFIRNYGYTLGHSQTILKAIASAFKKFNNFVTPAWRDYVDFHMVLPPLPAPHDQTEFSQQLKVWFVDQWPHEIQRSNLKFRNSYLKSIADYRTAFKIKPNHTITSIIDQALSILPALGTGGSAPVKNRLVHSGLLTQRLRRNKNVALLEISSQTFRNYALYSGPYVATAAIKHETGFRNRLIIAAPLPIYLRDAAYTTFLEPTLSTDRTTLFMTSAQLVKAKARQCSLSTGLLSNPSDLKSCESQQDQFVIQTSIDFIFSLLKEALPNASDLPAIYAAVKSSYEKGYIKLNNEYVEANQGNPSGIRLTQWFNTTYNNVQIDMADSYTTALSLPPARGKIGTGDDSNYWASSIVKILISKMFYNSANFKLNNKNDYIGVYTSEFLRYVLTPYGYYGYPARILRAMLFSNPYHNESDLNFNEELELHVSTFMTYYSRSLQSFPFHDLYYDLRNLFLAKANLSYDIHEIFSITHTPRSAGGLGVFPFYVSTPSYTYKTIKPPRFLFTTPPHADIPLPDHYHAITQKISLEIGLPYTPSDEFRQTQFLDYKVKIKSILPFEYHPPQKFAYDETYVRLIIREFYDTQRPYDIPSAYKLISKHTTLPFWSDLYRFANKHGVAQHLFDSDTYHLYHRAFHRKDLHVIASKGIPAVSVSFPQFSPDFISSLSNSIFSYFIYTHVSQATTSAPRLLESMSIAVEHILTNILPTIYNESPFYHGS
jgi:hypothetical protein